MANWEAASNGSVPENAVVGGEEHDSTPIYVARARHEGDLIPGKMVSMYGKCYIAWGGQELEKEEYEILCNVEVEWIKGKKDKIPHNAYPGGYTADGETLLIGRVKHENSVQLGKVHPSHGMCYISYGGQELSFKKYEVLAIKTD